MSVFTIGETDNFQLNMIKALGLPETTYNIEMKFEAGGLSIGKCEFYITGDMLEKAKAAMDGGESPQTEVNKRLLRKLDK